MARKDKADDSTTAAAGGAAEAAVTDGAAAPGGFDDTIARNRALPAVQAAAVPAVPHGYQATSIDERRRRLRILAGELIAEALRALREIDARGPALAKDLGDLAPPVSGAARLLGRYETASATQQALATLTQYNDEILAIAGSDVVKYLESVHEEYDHRISRYPQLSSHYPALVAFFEGRSTAITEGKAKAKAAKKTTGTGTETPADKKDK